MKNYLFLFLGLSLLFTACESEERKQEKLNKYVNEWLYDNMSALYYWNTNLPAFKSTTENPADYFETLIYKDDRFSAIFESYQDILNQLNGVSAAEIGFDFKLFRESDTNENVVAVVKYTKPGTQAATIGVKRGDIIRKINGQQMTMQNYGELIDKLFDSNASVTLTFSNLNGSVYTDKPAVTITKSNNYIENPIYLDTVYTIQTKKIGYLVYNSFTNDAGDNSLKYDLALNSTFEMFKNANITDLVVDLRYNSGGAMSSAINLASMMVPNLTTGKIFAYTDFNSNYTSYFNSAEFKRKYPNENPFEDNFATTIDLPSPKTDKYPVHNVGNKITKIYFITGKNTASASEMVINGLKPFLPCVLIGDTTVGKNVGSTLINDEENTKNQWAFMPIVLRYFNKDHQSEFTNGFVPDFLIKDDFNHQLGDTNEALLAKAISSITGIPTNIPAKIKAQPAAWKEMRDVRAKRSLLVLKSKAIDAYTNRNN
jgi:carboxyl-terminal processing protease